MRTLGVDLAWGEGSDTRVVNETGVVALESDGRIHDAAWTLGIADTIAWIERNAETSVTVFVDAPLVVTNATGQRACERQVGQRYGRWKVSANSTNLSSPRRAGTTLREKLEERGWLYDDGRRGPSASGLVLSECYPYTTLVGAVELGYGDERPICKRKPRNLSTRDWRAIRARSCDELIRRLVRLASADPPLRLDSYPATAELIDNPSPLDDHPYKHREDLIDAAVCAWTAQLWLRHGLARCQVLGELDHGASDIASIIAPCRDEQRLFGPPQ